MKDMKGMRNGTIFVSNQADEKVGQGTEVAEEGIVLQTFEDH